MVHGGNHWNHDVSVGEGQNGYFRTGQEFFDNDVASAFAEDLVFHHGYDCILCIFSGFCDDNTLTQCQTVRLDYGRNRTGFQVSQRCILVAEHFVFCSWNAVLLHQVLGEDLAAFDDGSRLVRTECRDASFIQRIHTAQHQRIVRCYHCEVDCVILRKIHNRIDILRADVYAGCVRCNPAVSRQRKDFFYRFIFFQFLDDGMLTAAATNY